MQLAKTSAKLAQLADAEFLIFHYVQIQLLEEHSFICYVGDINIAEPGALIGFAGQEL